MALCLMKCFKKKLTGYTIIASMVGQTIAVSVIGVWAGLLSIATPFETAIAAQERFDQIQQKYKTDDPTNNRSDDQRLNQTLLKYPHQTVINPNRENEIIQKYYLTPQTSRTVDLSAYGNYGDNAQQQIEDSVNVARDMSKSAVVPSTNASGGLITNYSNGGVSLTKDDSGNYVGTIDESKVTEHVSNQNEYTSSELNHSQTTFEADSHYGNETEFYASGTTKINSLKTDTASDATVYQTIQSIQNDNKPPEINPRSSIFNYGFNEVNDALDGTGSWLSSCTDESVDITREFTSTQSTNHLCMQPLASNSLYCEVERATPVAYDVIVQMAGKGKQFLTVEFDLKKQTAKTIAPTDSIATELKFEGPSFEDFCTVNNTNINRVSLGAWPNTTLDGSIDESTWIRELQAPTCANGLKGIVQVEDKTDDSGDTKWILNAQVRYRFTGEVGENKQYPAGCYDAIESELKESNGLAGFSDRISGGTESRFEGFCKFDSYTNIEVGSVGLPPEILETVPPFYNGDTGNKTWRVNLDGYNCDPTKGEDYCIVTRRATEEEKAAGIGDEFQCYSWDEIESQPNHCTTYQTDTQCQEIERTCAEGWLWERDDADDICFAYTIEYQCDEEIVSTVTSSVTQNTCAATLPCVGGNCETSNSEVNDQFADVLAMATVIQHMEDGMNCEDPTDPSTCTIFKGEGKFCSWEPSGLGNDCCEAPDGVDIYEYAQAAYGMLQADAFVAGLDGTSNAVVGGYQSLREPIANAATTAGEAVSSAWSSVSTVFTDAASTAAGNAVGEVVDASGAAMDIFSKQAMEKLQQAVMKYVYDSIPEELAQALMTETVKNGASTVVLSEGASQAVAVIGYVYAAYMVYQYIKLALNLLTACHEYEMDMGIRLATKQCIPVGKKYCAEDALGVCYLRRQDYCCYDSILSRIIMEQASPMLGHDLEEYTTEEVDGSKLRNCPGLTPEQLSNLDWNQIDLSEWINIMIESGIADFAQDLDKLTGSGRLLNNEGRENAVDRTTQRAVDAELAERAIETRSIINADDIDCSYVPRPLACYFLND